MPLSATGCTEFCALADIGAKKPSAAAIDTVKQILAMRVRMSVPSKSGSRLEDRGQSISGAPYANWSRAPRRTYSEDGAARTLCRIPLAQRVDEVAAHVVGHELGVCGARPRSLENARRGCSESGTRVGIGGGRQKGLRIDPRNFAGHDSCVDPAVRLIGKIDFAESPRALDEERRIGRRIEQHRLRVERIGTSGIGIHPLIALDIEHAR